MILADEALAARLGKTVDTDVFIARVVQEAREHGLTLGADLLRPATHHAPIGLSRWTTHAVAGAAWPPPSWLPVQVAAQGEQIAVDWAWFGAAPLTAPFFEDSLRRAMALPLNRLFRYRTLLADFVAGAATAESLAPNGFIFHMSRCGSTLTAQMIAALPRTIIVSEAAPIDAVVQIGGLSPQAREDRLADLLRAMIAAYGRRRTGEERRFVLKLDAWHTLALPLFRRAFPTVPWVFLYRDPVEVLVSQLRQPGAQMIPEFVPTGFYGIESFDHTHAYYARVLGRICEAALDKHRDGGLLVNYRELPQAVFAAVLPHFGIVCSDSEREIMKEAARRDAKAPHLAFVDDSAAKQEAATASIRALAERHLGAVYRGLEGLRNLSG